MTRRSTEEVIKAINEAINCKIKCSPWKKNEFEKLRQKLINKMTDIDNRLNRRLDSIVDKFKGKIPEDENILIQEMKAKGLSTAGIDNPEVQVPIILTRLIIADLVLPKMDVDYYKHLPPQTIESFIEYIGVGEMTSMHNCFCSVLDARETTITNLLAEVPALLGAPALTSF